MYSSSMLTKNKTESRTARNADFHDCVCSVKEVMMVMLEGKSCARSLGILKRPEALTLGGGAKMFLRGKQGRTWGGLGIAACSNIMHKECG